MYPSKSLSINMFVPKQYSSCTRKLRCIKWKKVFKYKQREKRSYSIKYASSKIWFLQSYLNENIKWYIYLIFCWHCVQSGVGSGKECSTLTKGHTHIQLAFKRKLKGLCEGQKCGLLPKGNTMPSRVNMTILRLYIYFLYYAFFLILVTMLKWHSQINPLWVNLKKKMWFIIVCLVWIEWKNN